MTVENTSQRDDVIHLVGVLSEGMDGYVTGMEAQGQAQMIASEVLPADAPWADLEALGIVRGAPVEGDALFVRASLPPGWRKQPSDHSMWSKIADERGVERVAIFYKAAFYDRRAFARVTEVSSLVGEIGYGDAPVALPPFWGRLTEPEKQACAEAARARLTDSYSGEEVKRRTQALLTLIEQDL